MKTAFIETLSELMDKHQDVITLTADMGFSVFEDLQKKHPDRFINTGVTEQATVSIAAGLAQSGFKVFFYAQASFATMRCFEQIHLDAAYNFLAINIIGVNAGLSLNQLGASHFAVEDVGIIRTLPGINIFTPGNVLEMKWAIGQAYKIKGPSYIRYTKLNDIADKKTYPSLSIGKPIRISNGKDTTLLVSGGIMSVAKKAALLLKKKNIGVGLYSVPSVKPLNRTKLLSICKNSNTVFTLEEHSVIGGLGSAVTEILSEFQPTTRVYRLGIPDKSITITGSIDYLLSYNGLSPAKIARAIQKNLVLDA